MILPILLVNASHPKHIPS